MTIPDETMDSARKFARMIGAPMFDSAPEVLETRKLFLEWFEVIYEKAYLAGRRHEIEDAKVRVPALVDMAPGVPQTEYYG